MGLLSTIQNFFRTRDDPAEALAQLILAAREDESFRQRLLVLLRAPGIQRESLVNTALHEMELRGEPEAARKAFAVLATERGASSVLHLLCDT